MVGFMLALTFNESLGLLAVTAALSGLLAPIVVQITNRRRLNEQRQFDEELKRETAFFEAQARFLADFSAAMWEYLEKGLAVSYAATMSPERFKKVWNAYDEQSFALLGRLGSQVSTADTLFSSTTAELLDDFYSNWCEETFDRELSSMARNPETTQAEWAEWHDRMHPEAQRRTKDLVRLVAREAGLTYEQRRKPPRSPGWFDRLKDSLARRKERRG